MNKRPIPDKSHPLKHCANMDKAFVSSPVSLPSCQLKICKRCRTILLPNKRPHKCTEEISIPYASYRDCITARNLGDKVLYDYRRVPPSRFSKSGKVVMKKWSGDEDFAVIVFSDSLEHPDLMFSLEDDV